MNNGQSREVVEALREGGIVALDEEGMFSLWVKTSCCDMNSQQLRKVADISDRYGRSYVLFTTRQTPHIPFINLKDVAEVKRELTKVELELDRCGARVRNLNVCYEAKLCSYAKTDCISLGERLENFFRNEITHKVKIGVVGCDRDCIAVRVLNDVGFIGSSVDGKQVYDVYVGGRLGVNASIGMKIAAGLCEEQCVRFVQNYIDLLSQGEKGERGADLIKHLGEEEVREALNAGLHKMTAFPPVPCPARLKEGVENKIILRVRASCGEVTSRQLRRIADVADKYGLGFVHFAIRGGPEIPGVDKERLEEIRMDLQDVGMQILDGGIDNIQSCYAGYCTEGLADGQSLLRRLEARVAELHLENPEITISASGCPNSCGIPHLSDIGFYGMVEPDVDTGRCTGCQICRSVCKRKAIVMKDNMAVIDQDQCRNCGQCIAICPVEAIREKRKGFGALVGARQGKGVRFGIEIARFLSEDEAFELGSRCLEVAKSCDTTVADIIDDIGIERFKAMVATAEVVNGTRVRVRLAKGQ